MSKQTSSKSSRLGGSSPVGGGSAAIARNKDIESSAVRRLYILIPLATGLLGALIGAYTSNYWAHNKIYEIKIDTLRRIMGNRFTIVEGATGRDANELFSALNEAVIVFHDSPEVIRSLDRLRVHGQGKESDNLVNLFRAMFADIGIEYEGLNDSFFTHPLTINQGAFQAKEAQ